MPPLSKRKTANGCSQVNLLFPRVIWIKEQKSPFVLYEINGLISRTLTSGEFECRRCFPPRADKTKPPPGTWTDAHEGAEKKMKLVGGNPSDEREINGAFIFLSVRKSLIVQLGGNANRYKTNQHR